MAELTEPEAIATAYGLLWLVSIDNTRVDSRRTGTARKLLLSLLTNDGQRDGIERAKRMELDGLPTPATGNDAAAEIERLEKLVYVPGQWRCAKCNFRLTQSNLYVASGTVGPRDEPGDKCPNCDGPLWRVSAMDDRNDAFKTANEMFDLAEARRLERDEVWSALSKLITLYGHYAKLLNDYDGGSRIQFMDAQDWIDRLRETEKREQERAKSSGVTEEAAS
jgi:uncharacterized protein with PIN domain